MVRDGGDGGNPQSSHPKRTQKHCTLGHRTLNNVRDLGSETDPQVSGHTPTQLLTSHPGYKR